MTGLRIFIVGLLIAGIVTGFSQCCVAAEPLQPGIDRSRDDMVAIALRPNVQTNSRLIRLVDVAHVTGGDPMLRNQIKQLDLEDGLAPGQSLTILPPQIEFRLRIARIDVERVSIKGSGVHVTSSSGSPVRSSETATGDSGHADKPHRVAGLSAISVDDGPLEREIVQAARECILSKLPWAEEDVDIRLAQSLPPEIHQLNSAAGYECAAEMRSQGPAVGRVQVRVISSAPKKPMYDTLVILDIRHFDQVVMTTRSIDRGRVLTASDVYVDRRDVSELTDYCSSVKELVGTTARRSIRALLPVRTSDVENASHSDSAIVIKRREQVRMVARVGALNVTATGEALQEGRLGEMIRLRNIDSSANVQGRVVGPGEVEISF